MKARLQLGVKRLMWKRLTWKRLDFLADLQEAVNLRDPGSEAQRWGLLGAVTPQKAVHNSLSGTCGVKSSCHMLAVMSKSV